MKRDLQYHHKNFQICFQKNVKISKCKTVLDENLQESRGVGRCNWSAAKWFGRALLLVRSIIWQKAKWTLSITSSNFNNKEYHDVRTGLTTNRWSKTSVNIGLIFSLIMGQTWRQNFRLKALSSSFNELSMIEKVGLPWDLETQEWRSTVCEALRMSLDWMKKNWMLMRLSQPKDKRAVQMKMKNWKKQIRQELHDWGGRRAILTMMVQEPLSDEMWRRNNWLPSLRQKWETVIQMDSLQPPKRRIPMDAKRFVTKLPWADNWDEFSPSNSIETNRTQEMMDVRMFSDSQWATRIRRRRS